MRCPSSSPHPHHLLSSPALVIASFSNASLLPLSIYVTSLLSSSLMCRSVNLFVLPLSSRSALPCSWCPPPILTPLITLSLPLSRCLALPHVVSFPAIQLATVTVHLITQTLCVCVCVCAPPCSPTTLQLVLLRQLCPHTHTHTHTNREKYTDKQEATHKSTDAKHTHIHTDPHSHCWLVEQHTHWFLHCLQ